MGKIIDIIILYGYQILFSIVLIIILGLIIMFLNKVFYKIMGEYQYRACLVTGCIGTPVHEIGHAIFCLIFGHKIVSIKLYIPNSEDGTLGYVSHTYNKKNIYHVIGNFFIGAGPILFGSGVLMLLLYLLVPAQIHTIDSFYSSLFDGSFTFMTIPNSFINLISNFFSKSNLINFRWWIFLIISLPIATHMWLSVPDLKHSFSSIGYLLVFILIIDIVLGLVYYKGLLYFVYGFMLIGSAVLNCMMLAIIMCFVTIIISSIVKVILKLFKVCKK